MAYRGYKCVKSKHTPVLCYSYGGSAFQADIFHTIPCNLLNSCATLMSKPEDVVDILN